MVSSLFGRLVHTHFFLVFKKPALGSHYDLTCTIPFPAFCKSKWCYGLDTFAYAAPTSLVFLFCFLLSWRICSRTKIHWSGTQQTGKMGSTQFCTRFFFFFIWKAKPFYYHLFYNLFLARWYIKFLEASVLNSQSLTMCAPHVPVNSAAGWEWWTKEGVWHKVPFWGMSV